MTPFFDFKSEEPRYLNQAIPIIVNKGYYAIISKSFQFILNNLLVLMQLNLGLDQLIQSFLSIVHILHTYVIYFRH